MPTRDQWQALQDAVRAYDETEDHVDPEKRGPVNLMVRALVVVRSARAVLKSHTEEAKPSASTRCPIADRRSQ